MKGKDKIAFVIYLLGILSLFAFGIAYFFCPTIMPYHHEAIGTPWEALGPGVQVLLQALIKMTAAGFFVCALSIGVILFIPFRRGEKWAHRAIPALALVMMGISLYVTLKVAWATGASTPWPASLIGILLAIFAFYLSPGKTKISNKERLYETS
jgi:hypothetical protein